MPFLSLPPSPTCPSPPSLCVSSPSMRQYMMREKCHAPNPPPSPAAGSPAPCPLGPCCSPRGTCSDRLPAATAAARRRPLATAGVCVTVRPPACLPSVNTTIVWLQTPGVSSSMRACRAALSLWLKGRRGSTSSRAWGPGSHRFSALSSSSFSLLGTFLLLIPFRHLPHLPPASGSRRCPPPGVSVRWPLPGPPRCPKACRPSSRLPIVPQY